MGEMMNQCSWVNPFSDKPCKVTTKNNQERMVKRFFPLMFVIWIYIYIPRPSKTCCLIDYYCRKHRCFHRDFKTIYSNVTVGLMNPPRIKQPTAPPKKCNLKTGGPPGLKKSFAWTLVIDPQCWYPILCSKKFYVQFFFFLIMSHQSQNHEILAIKCHQNQWNHMGPMRF